MAALKSNTKSPPKKSNGTTHKPLTAGKPILSTELIQDSDESDEDGLPVRNKDQESYKLKAVDARSQLKFSPKKLSSNEKKLPKRARAPTPSSDSELSSSEQAEKKNGRSHHKNKNVPHSAEESSTPTRPGVPAPRPAPAKLSRNPSSKIDISSKKKSAPDISVSKDRREDQDSTGSESSSGSSGESESDEDSDSSDGKSSQIKGPKAPMQKSSAPQPPSAYRPPPGFEAISVPANQSSTISDIFAPSNLQGKQIWHITAPASVPISLVKEVSEVNLRDGSSVLSYEDTEYGLMSDVVDIQNNTLLLPSAQSNDYRPSKIPLARTLHLQQIVRLPNQVQGSRIDANGLSKRAETRRGPYHVQPEGLKMRYHPFGVSTNSDSDSAPRNSIQVPKFRRPKPPTETPSQSKKRKHAEPNDRHQGIKGTPVKSNMQTPQPDPTIDTDTSPMEIDPPQAPEPQEPNPRSKKKRHVEASSTSPPAQAANGKASTAKHRKDKTPKKAPSVPLEQFSAQLDAKQKMQTEYDVSTNGGSKETKEERARRKEEKRRRREAEGR